MPATEPVHVGLKRRLTLPLLIFYGLGTIVGAGIYVLVGAVAGRAGLYAPLAFLVSALIAGLTAHSYAKLSARFPKSAGEAVYVSHAFGNPLLATMTGLAVIVTGVVSAATIANGFAGYLDVFVESPTWLVILLFIIILGGVAIWGILESVMLATIITILSIVGLLIVVYLSGDALLSVGDNWHNLLPPLELGAWTGITFGAFLAFYAFIGFEDMVNVAEEVREPQRTLPLAIYSALILAALLYVLIALVAILTLDLETLATSEAPLVDVVAAAGNPNASRLIAIFSLLSVTNSALAQIIMASRILYGMSRDGALPEWFASVSQRTNTPVRATLFTGVVVLLFALALPLVTLAEITSFIIILVFSLVNASYFRLQLNRESGRRIAITPLVAIVLCLFLLFVQSYVRLSA
ncbi:MAG: amino acid permease [Pseudomonadota bacterium]